MTYRTFCSFECPNEAVGEVTFEDDGIPLPICQEHLEVFQQLGVVGLTDSD